MKNILELISSQWFLFGLGILIIFIVFIVILFAFIQQRKRKSARQAISKIIKENGRIKITEAKKITGLKPPKIRKVFSEIINKKIINGFIVDNGEEIISNSSIVNYILNKGKTNLSDFSSEFGISINRSRKILTGLLESNDIFGTFTTDGNSFFTSQNLIDELRRK